ncbi:bifunctional adenosylcobinamide kinase/adenosylcobinamide-phosphate guanylyltransferase [Faunimonas sp. B44]|uniref:bifunctional adenosylcobinamide kinase/adenosylcobinamide-phosphate guanylyltransferase n=1 Tax=Faunimonas sp. B44 TaxID=3461493 RepID=UPI004044C9C5
MRQGIALVLGGARSGKSRHAEAIVAASGLDPVYLATAEAGDGEMAERIAEHRARRGAGWRTREAPVALPDAIGEEAGPGRVLLVDCLTLWLSNLMLAGIDIEERSRMLLERLRRAPGLVVLVSNEVGLGIVPDNALGRRFRDAQGRLNQAVAEIAGHVVFVAAGLPLVLKGSSA